ncbi:hypothetical protein LXL04_005635 [Taraxacum kok-saghyz]
MISTSFTIAGAGTSDVDSGNSSDVDSGTSSCSVSIVSKGDFVPSTSISGRISPSSVATNLNMSLKAFYVLYSQLTIKDFENEKVDYHFGTDMGIRYLIDMQLLPPSHIYCPVNMERIKYNTKRVCHQYDTNDWLRICYTVTHSFSDKEIKIDHGRLGIISCIWEQSGLILGDWGSCILE